MSSLFSKDMTPTEARVALFTAVKGKSEEEILEIEREFNQVAGEIIQKDLKQNEGYLTSDCVRKAE